MPPRSPKIPLMSRLPSPLEPRIEEHQSRPSSASTSPPPPRTVSSGFTSSMMILIWPAQPLSALPETVNRAPSVARNEALTPLTEPSVSPSSDVPLAIGMTRPSAAAPTEAAFTGVGDWPDPPPTSAFLTCHSAAVVRSTPPLVAVPVPVQPPVMVAAALPGSSSSPASAAAAARRGTKDLDMSDLPPFESLTAL